MAVGMRDRGFGGGGGRLWRTLRPPPGTLGLMGVTAALSALAVWGGFVDALVYEVPQRAPVEVPPLITNTFVNLGDSPIALIIFAALAAWFYQDLVRWLWHRKRVELIASVAGGFVGLWLLNRYVLPGLWGLLTAVLFVGWFASGLERRWGAKRLLLFSTWVALATNLMAGLLLWAWPESIGAATGRSAALPSGDAALVAALLTAWSLMLGRQRLMLLRIEARKLVWVLVAFGALEFLLVGRALGLYTLGGVGVAWLLITGNWRPDRWYNQVRLWQLRRRNARRRARFDLIQGGRDRTIHRAATRA